MCIFINIYTFLIFEDTFNKKYIFMKYLLKSLFKKNKIKHIQKT